MAILGVHDKVFVTDPGSTFHCNVDTRCKKQAAEAVVEDLVPLERRSGVVCDLDTCGANNMSQSSALRSSHSHPLQV